MSSSLEEYRRRIESLEELQEIARSMKVLAASRIHQLECSARAQLEHTTTVELAFRAILIHGGLGATSWITGAREGTRTAMIVFGSDRGLCGRFDESVAELLRERVGPASEVERLICVGHRLAERLRLQGGPPLEKVYAAPGSLHGVGPLVESLLQESERWRARNAFDRLVLCHHRRTSASRTEPELTQLLPIPDEWFQRLGELGWPARGLPTYTVPLDRMLEQLAWSYLFGRIRRAVTESMEAETLGRLVSMQDAEKNLQKRRDELRVAYRRRRQESITEELFDVWEGGKAARRSSTSPTRAP